MKSRKAKKIILDDEIIARREVTKILENTNHNNHGKQKSDKIAYADDETQATIKRADNINTLPTNEKQNDTLIGESEGPVSVSSDISQETAKIQESKRSLKRKRYAQLLQVKQLKSVLTNQQRSLNYLSLWKHNKDKWKFEKLRQVWLQQNMYDIDKVPDEFFAILIDYFTLSKGRVKDAIVENAVKIVEQLADSDLKDTNGEISCNETKLIRARTVVQTLGL